TSRRMCRGCGKIFNLASDGDLSACTECGGEIYQRDDDTEAVVRKRLAAYDEQTSKLVPYYAERGILHTVDGNRTPGDVYASISDILRSV
ncbi:adenylate kinase, partial [bacterium]|nr:adenylate kinase [bacterium]